jgi:membrane protease YdiL (CAAX protease family)
MGVLKAYPFSSKLVMLICLMLGGMFLGTILALVLIRPVFGLDILSDMSLLTVNSANPATIPLLKFVQFMQATFMFIVPAHLYATWVNKDNVVHVLSLHKAPAYHFLFGASLIIAFAPTVAGLSILNEQMQLPGFMAGMESWMKTAEQSAERLTNMFLQADTFSGLLINLLVIAIIPAIGEELIFRGILQKLFIEKTRSIHAGIWITAIIFSAFHMQFYGFLPRVALGAVLGYGMVWSGTIWVPVLMHLINNGTAVILDFLYKNHYITINFNAEENFPLISVLFSILISFALVFYWNRRKHL